MVLVHILFNLSFGKALYTVFQICIILLYKETLRMSNIIKLQFSLTNIISHSIMTVDKSLSIYGVEG